MMTSNGKSNKNMYKRCGLGEKALVLRVGYIAYEKMKLNELR